MLIIVSAQYVDSELRSEFGDIPPAFLPVGNKRLFVRQVESFPKEDNIVITLPEGFVMSVCDQKMMADRNIRVLYIDGKMSLKDSIITALGELGELQSPIKILFGDTLFISDLDTFGEDVVSVSPTNDFYRWSGFYFDNGKLRLTDNVEQYDSELVVSGYFNISDCKTFMESLLVSDSYTGAIDRYANLKDLRIVRLDEWLDFGHVHTYFKSKSKLTTQRSFNEMKITQKVVYKNSKNKEKMQAEYEWFTNIPAELKIYTPHVLNFESNHGKAGYGIEYLYMTALNELAVFGKLPSVVWRNILSSCDEFLLSAKKYTSDNVSIEQINTFHNEKVFERLARYSTESGLDLKKPWVFNGHQIPSITDMAMHCCALIRSARASDICVSHGDLCFSNMLYDFRSQCIKVIDPRGVLNDGQLTVYGDARYDVAKLLHSIVGRYDVIIAGLCNVAADNYTVDFSFYDESQYSIIAAEARKINFGGYSQEEIIPIVINLFFSMLPLHADDSRRQFCLLANAMRLYWEFLGNKK